MKSLIVVLMAVWSLALNAQTSGTARKLKGPALKAMVGTVMYPGEWTREKVQSTKSGLKYIDMVVGKGPIPQRGSSVTVHYTGYLRDGKKFDSSMDKKQPFTFTLGQGQVIRGWDEGVATMRVGGKRKLIIPPDLGYGQRGFGNIIPPNSELIFDVQLLSFR
jgi:peptidylprolyl isomerase